MRAPRRTLAASILFLEAFVVFLAGIVAKDLANLSTGAALSVHSGLAAACLGVAGLLRSRIGYLLGWLLQAAIVGTGVWVPSMFVIGLLFGALWAFALYAGGKIEREQAAYARARPVDSDGASG